MSKSSYKVGATDRKAGRPLKSLKLLASDARFNILCLLYNCDTNMCVSDIADKIDMTHSATSHQLSKLEDADVLTVNRNGQTRCYRYADTPLAKQTIAFIKQCNQ